MLPYPTENIVASRRVPLNNSELSFDHAAPYFDAQSELFAGGLLHDWQVRPTRSAPVLPARTMNTATIVTSCLYVLSLGI